MSRSEVAAATAPTPHQADSADKEIGELLNAADGLHRAIGEYASRCSLPHEVAREWKRLGECLAWLQRSPR